MRDGATVYIVYSCSTDNIVFNLTLIAVHSQPCVLPTLNIHTHIYISGYI